MDDVDAALDRIAEAKEAYAFHKRKADEAMAEWEEAWNAYTAVRDVAVRRSLVASVAFRQF